LGWKRIEIATSLPKGHVASVASGLWAGSGLKLLGEDDLREFAWRCIWPLGWMWLETTRSYGFSRRDPNLHLVISPVELKSASTNK